MLLGYLSERNSITIVTLLKMSRLPTKSTQDLENFDLRYSKERRERLKVLSP